MKKEKENNEKEDQQQQQSSRKGGCKAHLLQTPLPDPYVPTGQSAPQVVLSVERPVPAG
jgi:hypothetical protein